MSPMDGRDELRGRFTRWIVITAEHAQKNYLRAEKKQLQTVPLEEADVAIVDTALLSAGVTPDSFDFEEQRLAEAFRELPLMRRRILEMLFVEELTMTNEELNTRLYEKMFAEQEQFRDWLLSQPPAEILNHAYEYTVREDILMSLEYNDLEDSQARALLKSGKPLKQIFERWEDKETSHMENIWDTVQEQTKAAEAKQKAKAQKER